MAEQSSTLCWSCKYACGKCPWSECDKETRKLKWRPVEGWRAIKTKVLMNSCGLRESGLTFEEAFGGAE